MPSCNNILVFIGALVISTQTLPTRLERGSLTYDPNSITQNEKILRLFLRLASHTANRLIHLKKEAKRASILKKEAIVPQVRTEFSDDHPRQRIGGRGQYGRYGQSGYPYGPDSPEQGTRGSHNTGYYNRPRLNGPHMPGPSDEVNSVSNGRNSHRYLPTIQSNDQDPLEARKSNASSSQKDTVVLPRDSDKSTEDKIFAVKTAESLGESSSNVRIEDSTDVPVEIESRMLFSNDNNVSNDNSKNTNNSDTKIDKIGPFDQHGNSMPQSDPMVVKQNAESDGFSEYKEENYINHSTTEVNNVSTGSAGTVVVHQTAGSTLSSQISDAGSSGAGSKSSESSHQTKSPSSHLQPTSAGVEGITSMIKNAGVLDFARQAMSDTSSLPSGASGMINTAEGFAAGVQSVAPSAKISRQSQTATSKLHSSDSMSSEMISSAQTVASGAQDQDAVAEMSHLRQAEGSQTLSGITEQLSAFQLRPSKALMGTAAAFNENQENQMTTALVGSQGHGNSKNKVLFGSFDQNKSGEILANANQGASALLDQGSSLASPNQAVSSITNLGSGPAGKVIQGIPKNGSKLVEGIGKPVTSMAEGPTGKISEFFGGPLGEGSKINGTTVLDRVSESRTAFEKSFERGDAPSALIKSGGDGVSEIGSTLTGSVPLFRSFPDVNDEPATPKKPVIDSTRSKTNTSEAIDGPPSSNQRIVDKQGILPSQIKTSTSSQNPRHKNTSTERPSPLFYDEYANHQDASQDKDSDLDLEEYANQFADALRPLQSMRG